MMTRSPKLFATQFAALFALGLLTTGPALAKDRLAFSGGPDGGTFQYFSNGIATRLTKSLPDVDVSNMASAGSLENLRRVNSGDADFGIVYSGDAYLGQNGKLTKDENKYENVYALAYLYGAPAHLLTIEGSGIGSVGDLVGKRVAVGGAGSGAASAAQRYFTELGVWSEMKVEYLGYSQAASALGDKLIDAMWVFAGFPNSSVIQAAASNKIKLISLVEPAEETGFFEAHPYYTALVIPAGTYQGVDYEVTSFQDSALWVAGKHVKAETVKASVAEVFSPEGIAYMVKVKSTANEMTVQGALNGIVTPVHPGAAAYWAEQGLTLTHAQTVR